MAQTQKRKSNRVANSICANSITDYHLHRIVPVRLLITHSVNGPDVARSRRWSEAKRRGSCSSALEAAKRDLRNAKSSRRAAIGLRGCEIRARRVASAYKYVYEYTSIRVYTRVTTARSYATIEKERSTGIVALSRFTLYVYVWVITYVRVYAPLHLYYEYISLEYLLIVSCI